MLKTRGRGAPPPLPPGLEVYRPPEVLGSAVLVVEDEAPMRAQLRLDLGDLGYQPRVAGTAAQAQALLGRERVAGGVRAPVPGGGAGGGVLLLPWIRQDHPRPPGVVISAPQGHSGSTPPGYQPRARN